MQNRFSNHVMKFAAAAFFAIITLFTIIPLTAMPAYADTPRGMGDLGGIYVMDINGAIAGTVIPVNSGSVDSAITTANKKTGWSADGGTLVYDLRGDWSSKHFIENTNGNIIIKLNGHTWTTDIAHGSDDTFATNHAITIEGGGGTITAVTNTADSVIEIDSNRLIVRDTTFVDCVTDNEGVLSVYGEAASVSLENVTFKNCSNEGYGAAVYVDSVESTLTFDNCTFDNCTVNYAIDTPWAQGGAIFCNDSYNTFKFVGCTFTECKATTDDGGAIYLDASDNNLIFYDTVFKGCSAKDRGGAIYIEKANILTFTNTIFDDCHAGKDGGAIYVNGTPVSLYGNSKLLGDALDNSCTIRNCVAEDNGGAIYASWEGGSGCQIRGFDFIGNRAESADGGAIYLGGNVCKVTNCFFRDNVAGDDGGAIAIGYWNIYVATVKNCYFYNDYASDAGGEISAWKNFSDVSGNDFYFAHDSQKDFALDPDDLWDNRNDAYILTYGTVGVTLIPDDSSKPKYIEADVFQKLSELDLDSNVPIRPGYRFECWCTDKDCKYSPDLNRRFMKPMTLYGKWTEISDLHVTYAVNGDRVWGEPEDVDEPEDNTSYLYNSEVTVAPALSTEQTWASSSGKRVEGTWTFSGWDQTESPFRIKEDTTITGTWTFTRSTEPEPEPTFHVTYQVQDDEIYGAPGDAGAAPVDGMDYPYNYLVRVAPALTTEQTWATVGGDTVEGTWAFSGWDQTVSPFRIKGDTTITGIWTFTEKSVPDALKVRYLVRNDKVYGAPADAAAAPVDNNKYVSDSTVELAAALTTTETRATLDGKTIEGTWTFSGWDHEDGFTITENTNIIGSWTFTENTNINSSSTLTEDAESKPETSRGSHEIKKDATYRSPEKISGASTKPGSYNHYYPDSVNPDPVDPDSVNPVSINPTPDNPDSVNPDSVNPDSDNPDNPNTGDSSRPFVMLGALLLVGIGILIVALRRRIRN